MQTVIRQIVAKFPFRYLLLFILILPAIILRDFTPNNELKYLSIVDEALQNGHFFTFYNQGEPYSDKPPLYFWLFMFSRWITGEYSMFYLSLFSVIPAFISIHIMNKWVKKETSLSARWSATLMLFTSAFFIGSGLVLRMDMLMCMFILLALHAFYKQYSSGKRRPIDRFLLPFYIFMAIFSKGPIGLIIPFLSIIIFLVVKKELRHFSRYFGLVEWCVLLGLCATWFLCIYLEGGNSYLQALLFHQTINRAIDSFDHKQGFWYYGVSYWYSTAPWSILYITTFIIAIKKRLVSTDKEKFFLSIIVPTFIALSLFSAKLDIYMLPLFPFFTYLTILLLPKIHSKWIALALYIPTIILTIASIGAFFIKQQPEMIASPYIFIALILLLLACGGAYYQLYHKQLLHAINCIALGILVAVFAGSFALPQINPYIGFTTMTQKAQIIAKDHQIDHYYYYKFRSGENMDVYLHQDALKITDEDTLFSTYQKGNCLIFIKEKNVTRSPRLAEWLQQIPHEKTGNFYLVYTRKE